jgi:O-antigen biosynthesis protein
MRTLAPPGTVRRDVVLRLRDRWYQPLHRRRAAAISSSESSSQLDWYDAQVASRGALVEALQKFLASERILCFPDVVDPLVSIVVPTWNSAHTILAMLESLLRAEVRVPYEVILVDNGSKGETLVLLNRLVNVHVKRNASNVGFGEASNQGAALARGEFVCFLNSDVIVSPRWLDELVAVLESAPTSGAVGARLIWPNRKLQEAGSVLWSDGTAEAYGRGNDPFAPEYCYVRTVDFCSAACLLVRQEKFRLVGGFDAQFTPAYYEDVDLCLSLRHIGASVLYAPVSVIHLEHGSGNRSSAIDLMERNRPRLLAKWHDELSTTNKWRSRDILRVRDRRPGWRVVVIEAMIPDVQHGSGYPRTVGLLDALIESGCVITYLPVDDPTPIQPATRQLQSRGVEVLYGVTQPESVLRERAGLYDVAMVCRPTSMKWIPVVRKYGPRTVIVYDAEAIFAVRSALQAEVEGNPISERRLHSMIKEELRLAGDADIIVVVSPSEREMVYGYYPQTPLIVWGNAVRGRTSKVGYTNRKNLLFVGYLEFGPNNDALLQLIREVMPRVLARIDCALYVVGAGAQPATVAAAGSLADAIFFVGAVEDLDPIYDAYRVFVAPHRFAAGIPVKIVNAMAAGLPCVISTLYASQLSVTDGIEVLVARDPDEFAAKIELLYQDEDLWSRIQKNALAYVAKNFNPDVLRAKLVGEVESAVARRSRR